MVGAAVTALSRFMLGNNVGTVFPLLDSDVSVTCALPSLVGAVGLWSGIILCKKGSQVKSKKTAFSHEKSTKSQGKVKKY